VEEPTYTGAISVLAALDARVVGVPLDDEGIRPDLLTLAMERHRPRVIYLQPTFHNPTTRVMSERRRREVLEIASRFRCLIVEDDWAGDLRFEGERLPTLYALDGGRHVLYLSTFSKKLLPGLRVGWVAAPEPVFERLLALKQIEDCGTSPLVQAALHAFIEGGGQSAHLARVREAYKRRAEAMDASMRTHFPAGATWTRPSGGLFTWVMLADSVDGDELFAAARERGVLVGRGSLFHVNGGGRNTLKSIAEYISGLRADDRVGLVSVPYYTPRVDLTTNRTLIENAASLIVGASTRNQDVEMTVGEAAAIEGLDWIHRVYSAEEGFLVMQSSPSIAASTTRA
jgi:DNA-binding transcriptional MocR family regulator